MTDIYKTSDIHLAAALLTVGHRFTGVEPEGTRGRSSRAIFCFEGKDAIQTDVTNYMNDELRASPRELFGRLRELKGLASNLYL